MTHETLLPALASAYGWPDCRLVGRLSGGEWNDVWRVHADGSDFVVRMAPQVTTHEALMRSHRLMRLAADWVPRVHPPVLNLAGGTAMPLGSRLVAVFPYVVGDRALRGRIRPEQAGGWLGMLHQVPIAEPGLIPVDSFETLPVYTAALSHRGLDLPTLRNQFAAWRVKLEGQPIGLLHGDYYPSNIIVSGEETAGVVDWDEASVGPLVWEIGRALWEFAGDAENATFSLDIAKAFLGGYCQAGGPVPDKALLTGAMAQNRLWDAMWAFQSAEGFDENLEYHAKHLQAMDWIVELEI